MNLHRRKVVAAADHVDAMQHILPHLFGQEVRFLESPLEMAETTTQLLQSQVRLQPALHLTATAAAVDTLISSMLVRSHNDVDGLARAYEEWNL